MIRYDKEYGPWPSSRRCGRVFAGTPDGGMYYVGTTDGSAVHKYGNSYESTVNCPVKKAGWSNNARTWERAVCDKDIEDRSFYQNNTCPKGWGKSWVIKSSGEYCKYAQGHIDGYITNPVYGYVTRYRTVYYNYITARVSKA